MRVVCSDVFVRKKKDKQEDVSVNDWVNVDDSYDARSVGKARGDWSSFRQDDKENAAPGATTQIPQANNDGFVDIDYHETDFDNRRGWNGGAFSLSRLKRSQNKAEEPTPEQDEIYDDVILEESQALVEDNPYTHTDDDAITAEQINRELRKLQDFRHPDIDTEVWFVALGSDQYSHSGITAFLDEHADEMKGAVIINLEALGAGTLSVVDQESETLRPIVLLLVLSVLFVRQVNVLVWYITPLAYLQGNARYYCYGSWYSGLYRGRYG